MIKEIVKDIAQYIMPICSVLISLIALWKTRKVEKMEQRIREYDAFIKEAEVAKIKQEQSKRPAPLIDARITNIAKGKYKLYVFNKGDGNAYNIDYEIERGSSVLQMKEITPFEYLEPGGHFEEPVIVVGGSSKYRITLFWEDDNGQKVQKELIKSLE